MRSRLSFARKCDLKLGLFNLQSLDDAPIYIAGLSRPGCAWLSDTCIGKHPARLINGLRFPHPHLRRMNLVLSCSLLRGLSPRCASRATAALNVSEKMRLITICAPAANGRFDGPHRSIRLTGARSALGR